MKTGKKFLALLLCLTMVVSLLSGAFVVGAAEETAAAEQFTTVSKVTAEKYYLLAAAAEGKLYALAIDGETFSAKEIGSEGDAAVACSESSAIWYAETDSTFQNVALAEAGAEKSYFYPGSSGLMMYKSARSLSYNGETGVLSASTSKGDFVMTFADGAFNFEDSTTAKAAAIILLETTREKAEASEEAEEPFEAKTFALDESGEFQSNYYYLLAVEDGGKYYALSTDGTAFMPNEIGTAGAATITTADTQAIWLCDTDLYFKNVGSKKFMYTSSHADVGFCMYSSGKEFAYDAATGEFSGKTSAGYYAVTYENGAFSCKVSSPDAAAAKFVLFSVVADDLPVEDPNNWEGKVDPAVVPETNNVETQVRTANKNEDGSIVLAFTSDVHYDGEHNNLATWLPIAEEKYGYIDAMGFCGDMGSAYISGEAYWDTISDIFDYMDSEIAAGNIGAATYTYGNHEWFMGAGGEYMTYYEKEEAQRLMRNGEGIRTEDYIIYNFGASPDAGFDWNTYGYNSKHMYTVWESDLAVLDEYLSKAPTDIPIFILTHYPIHIWEDRQIVLGQQLIDVLNKYENVVVLWGHNHSDKDVNYYTIRHAGDEIEIYPKGTNATINFDYMAAGTTADAEYTGPEAGSAWTLNKGLIVTIAADGSLKYDYITIDGSIIEENGPTLVSFRTSVDWTIFESKYVEVGGTVTAPEAPEIDGYHFVGWDVDFTQPITQPTLATARYELNTADASEVDTSKVYVTIEQNGSYVTGTSGTPIALYAVTLEDGMTVGDVFTKVHELEYADGVNGIEVTDSTYGFFNLTKIWGVTPDNGILAFDGANYVDAAAAAVGGECYYVPVYNSTSEDFFTPGFMLPDFADAEVGKQTLLYAQYYAFSSSDYSYSATGLNGDVYVGESLSTLEDTGIDAENGSVCISFDKAGTYYVVVKSTTSSAGDAIGVVTVKSEGAFTDVSSDAWYAEAVQYCQEKGLMKGISDTEFGPTVTMNRAMAATILYRIAQAKDLGFTGEWMFLLPYTDLQDILNYDYAYEAIAWLTMKGVMNGYEDGSFGADDPITREQLAAVLFRFAKVLELDVSVGEDTNILSYNDAFFISEWAIPAIQWAAGEGIMNGDTNGYLNPAATANRAEVAAMLQRFCAVLDK